MSIQKQIFPGNPNIEIKSAGGSGLFTNYVFKAIPLAFDESMSYYEVLCGLLDYLKNTIIPVVNNNAEAVAELQKLYVELHDYVENYFDNLDVQEEINNKLDKMVEDGTLPNIIKGYLGDYISKIDTDYIKTNKFRDNVSSTDYYITTIGAKDKYDKPNILRLGIAYDDTSMTSVEAPHLYSKRKNNLFTCNSGIFYSQKDNPTAYGIVIKNGQILKNEELKYYNEYPYILGIKENGEMKSYLANGTITADDIIADGCVDAFVGFYPLFENGEKIDITDFPNSGVNPRQIICRYDDGHYLLFTCDGRTDENLGMTLQDAVRIISEYKPDFAFALDGGGSTSSIVKGIKINKNIDSYGRVDRAVPTMLCLDKSNQANNSINELFNDLGNFEFNYNVNEINRNFNDANFVFLDDFQKNKNIFDRNQNFTKDKYIDDDGNLVDYTGILLTDYIRVPSNEYIILNGGIDWLQVSFFDKNKKFIRRQGYTSNVAFTTPKECCYIRTIVRDSILKEFQIKVTQYALTGYTPYDWHEPVGLFSNPNGQTENIELLIPAENFRRIRFFGIDSNNVRSSCEVYNNKANGFVTNIQNISINNNNLIISGARITCSYKTITIDRAGIGYVSSSSVNVSPADYKITRIEGVY